jgi:hypothetical protein
MVKRVYRYIQAALLIIGAGSFFALLKILSEYAETPAYLTKDITREVYFHYGKSILYLSSAEAWPVHALEYMSIVSLILIILNALIAGDFRSRYIKRQTKK